MSMGRDLILREPALAMLMGALPQGDHFGFGDDYGHPGYGFGLMSSVDPSQNMGLPGYGYGYGYGEPEYGAEEWYGYGEDFFYGAVPAGPAASPVRPPMAPRMVPRPPMMRRPPGPPLNPAQAAAMARAAHGAASTSNRAMLLDPNRDSTVKVERYSFSFSPATNLVLGTASAIANFTQQPSTSIKGQRVIMNAPMPGFVLISTLQIANVNVLVGGTEDAFTYSAGAMGVMLDLPRLDPQNRATSAGAYTGVLPPGYTSGNAFQFIITLQGPATLAGGYGQ